MFLRRRSFTVLALLSFSWNFSPAQSSSQQSPSTGDITFRTTVRRVIVDVVVRDSNNQPVHGLTARDFTVYEDGRPQTVLSFDVHDFNSPSISIPPNTPHLPPNSFVNIPATPERGPLYVILYDLVNTQVDDQIDARRQILKFINNKPSGTRFAIFVRTDSLYMVQGFTEDKNLLFAAMDPQNPKPHIPRVFLMSRNAGYGDPVSALDVLTKLGEFLEGIPERKNLIWMAGTFPLALFPRKEDPRDYRGEIQSEINSMTRAQVAVYPVNVRGVIVNPEGALTGAGPHMGVGGASVGTSASNPATSATDPDNGGMMQSVRMEGLGDSVANDYMVQTQLAKSTGGRATFSTNDVTAALEETTETDGNYYSLSYSPTNEKNEANRRSIAVKLDRPGYQLYYRRYYYTGALLSQTSIAKASDTPGPSPEAGNSEEDALQANMKHGAPMLHDLLFSAHLRADGRPLRATAEQMSQLADQPAYFQTRHKDKPLKPLAPVDLQRYAIDYRVTDLALKSKSQGDKSLAFEFAAAAFDAENRMVNGVVNDAVADNSSGNESSKSGVFRVRQQIDVPVNAAWIRIGVRDKLTNRIGTLEVQLPLVPESPSPAVTSAR